MFSNKEKVESENLESNENGTKNYKGDSYKFVLRTPDIYVE